MPETKRKAGRPGKEPAAGERVGLSLRVTPETKRALDAAAAASGRSLSQEAEMRLERAFQDEQLLPQLLDLAYGRDTAGLLLLIGECLRDTAAHAAAFSGARLEPRPDWMSRPWVYRQAEDAIAALLAALEPPGTRDAPAPKLIEAMGPPLRLGMEHLGRGFAAGVLAALFGDPDSAGHLQQRLRPARERLAAVIEARKGGEGHAG
jgi:TraY domain